MITYLKNGTFDAWFGNLFHCTLIFLFNEIIMLLFVGF